MVNGMKIGKINSKKSPETLKGMSQRHENMKEEILLLYSYAEGTHTHQVSFPQTIFMKDGYHCRD